LSHSMCTSHGGSLYIVYWLIVHYYIVYIVSVYYVELYCYHGQFTVLSRREPVSCVCE